MSRRTWTVPATTALLASLAVLTPAAQSGGRDIKSWATANISSLLTYGGTYTPVDPLTYNPNASFVGFWNVAKTGPESREGVVLAEWQYNGAFNIADADTTKTRAVVFEQQADSSLKDATDTLFGNATTHGTGSVIVADFNRDGRDDVLLPAHNESPQLWRSSVAFMSRGDGLFTRVDLDDQAANHGTSLMMVNGVPKVFGFSLQEKGASPRGSTFQSMYSWNGNGFTVQRLTPTTGLSGNSGVGGAFTGDSRTWVVVGDVYNGPGLPPVTPSTVCTIVGWVLTNDVLTAPPATLPAPYFNDKPEYAQYVSAFEPTKTHNPRIYSADLNKDGLPDIIPFATIWQNTADGFQKSQLQLLINRGDMKFTDETNTLAPEFSEDSVLDYSLMMKDVDTSGIETFFLATPIKAYTTAQDAKRQGNYILVNDGTGRLYAAMHDEFRGMTEQLRTFVRTKVPTMTPASLTPQFIPYRTPNGVINFGVMVGLTTTAYNGVRSWAMVSLNTQINLETDFRRDLTIPTRNGSKRIRTFAGNDTISRASSDPDCRIDGGLGTNVVIYPGPRSNWTITRTAEGATIKPASGSGGTDTLIRIQTARFADGDVSLQ